VRRHEFAGYGEGQPLAFIRRSQALAFFMAAHPRLGARSAARVLDPTLRRFISSLATLHSLEEIYQIAERERSSQQDAVGC